jgi:hypothetical protein
VKKAGTESGTEGIRIKKQLNQQDRILPTDKGKKAGADHHLIPVCSHLTFLIQGFIADLAAKSLSRSFSCLSDLGELKL